jgi:GT2 family glycosyltransferase
MGPSLDRPTTPPPGRATVARRVRDALGPVAPLADPQPVSVVMLNRNRRPQLERVVPLLESATDFPAIELVVVDSDSNDGSLEYLDLAPVSYPIVVEANDRDLSFAEGSNRGAALASFELLLFMSTHVEPFEPGWLRELVVCLRRSRASAVGATLLHGGPPPGQGEMGYAIRHQGFRFRRRDGHVTPIDRLDATAGLERLGGDVAAPAVTATCLLIERSAFDQVGGFTPGFGDRYAGVDLGLKLLEAGGVPLCSGRSVLFHHAADIRAFGRAEQRLLMTRWGPQLEREYMRDRFDRVGLWSADGGPDVALTLGSDPDGERTARELGDALESRGWQVAYLEQAGDGWSEPPASTDLLLVSDDGYGASLPSGACAAGWILRDAEQWVRRPWLRHLHLLLAGSDSVAETLESAGRHVIGFPADGDWDARARELSELVEERSRRWRFCVRLPRARADEMSMRATRLRRELERRGHLCTVQLADEWERLDGLTADVVVGLGARYVPKPAQLNALWLDGSPDAEALGAGWDVIAVQSGPIADWLGSRPPAPPLISAALGDADGGMSGAVDRLLEALVEVAAPVGLARSIVTQAA